MPKGKLIAIEGTDGSGKATQANLLVDRLKKEGFEVVSEDFPQYGQKSAGLVEEYLNGKYGTAEELGPYAPSVFYAVDRFAAKKRMMKALNRGQIIVSNRYVGSSLGHQGSKIQDDKERDEYFEWLFNLEYGIFGIPQPDINILLRVPAEVAQKLVDEKEQREYTEGKKRDMHEDDLQHLKQAEQTYMKIADKFDYQVIDCVEEGKLLSKEKIAEKVWQKVLPLLK